MYDVVIESFAERHFIKTFHKKYKQAWNSTLVALVRELKSFDIILQKEIAEEISGKNNESRHGSGNRCIVAKHKKENKIRVLLVYHKNNLGGGCETVNWKKIIKENYSEYDGLLSL